MLYTELPIVCVCVSFCVSVCVSVSRRDMRTCLRDRVNANYERMASSGGSWFRAQDLSIPETLFVTYSGAQRANHSAMTHKKLRFVPAERYHTLGTTASQGYNNWPLTPGTIFIKKTSILYTGKAVQLILIDQSAWNIQHATLTCHKQYACIWYQ